MSWVFVAGARALKLKKPVRYPFLDFSTLQAREFYCREEVRLNSRLAPGIYLGVVALQWHDGKFGLCTDTDLPGTGRTVDWLVQMVRLPAKRTLLELVISGEADPGHVDALAAVLAAFYRSALPVAVGPDEYVARFRRAQAWNRDVLLRPRFSLVSASKALDRFDSLLTRNEEGLRQRAADGRIVDGHGDLRPEHVWLLDPPVVIDCLEFNAELRQVDPFDELAFLGLECEMAGAAWVGERLARACADALRDRPSPALMHLYTAQRALLRARLAAAHLLDPQPRSQARWQPLAQRYLERSLTAMDALERG